LHRNRDAVRGAVQESTAPVNPQRGVHTTHLQVNVSGKPSRQGTRHGK
jgi:hypothetical protein